MVRLDLVLGEQAPQIESLEDAERHQGDDALSVRRQLEDAVSAITAADRLDPFGLRLIEVFADEVAAGPLQRGKDPVADLSAIERVAAILADRAPRPRKILLMEDLARLGRNAARQVGRRIRGEALELRGAPFPDLTDLRADGEAFLGIGRSGLDERARDPSSRSARAARGSRRERRGRSRSQRLPAASTKNRRREDCRWSAVIPRGRCR